MKQELAKQILLVYPNPNLPFEIYADASDNGIGLAIFQNKKPISFFSHTLIGAQKNYTTTQKETLAIVKGLQANRDILLGRKIRIFTDHKNITYLHSANPQTVRWRIAISEFSPEINWIEGEKNVVADFLSRYPVMEEVEELIDFNPYQSYAIQEDRIPVFDLCPVDYAYLKIKQASDHKIQSKLQQGQYSLKLFQGHQLIIQKTSQGERIVVPESIQGNLVKWYHEFLGHPGITRLELTIRQHFTFKGLSTVVENLVTHCSKCQKVKIPKKHYGYLPLVSNTTPIPFILSQ